MNREKQCPDGEREAPDAPSRRVIERYLDDLLHDSEPVAKRPPPVESLPKETAAATSQTVSSPRLVTSSAVLASDNKPRGATCGVPEPVVQARIQVPNWAQEPFRCLFFRLLGVTLAVPLASLHGITRWNGELTKIPGQPDWYLGLWLYRGSRVVVVDIARLIMPERLGLQMTAPECQHLLIVGQGGGWGLCCGAIQRPGMLDQQAVKWRPENSRQPWFAGTVVDRLCLLLNIPALLAALGTDYA